VKTTKEYISTVESRFLPNFH